MTTIAIDGLNYANEAKAPILPTSSNTSIALNRGQDELNYDSDSGFSTLSSRRRRAKMIWDLEENSKRPWGAKRLWNSVYVRLWLFLAALVTLVM